MKGRIYNDRFVIYPVLQMIIDLKTGKIIPWNEWEY